MRINLRQMTSLLIVGLQLMALPAGASIPPGNVRLIDFSLVTNYSIFDSRHQLAVVPRVLAVSDISADDLTLRVPPALQAQSNAQSVGTWDQNQATAQANSALGKQVLNNNINRVLADQKAKGGAVGNTAKTLQNSTQTNVSFGGNDPGSIQHNVKVKVDAAMGQATMDYTGIAHAQLVYGVGANYQMRAAIIQNIAKQTDLVIDHTTNHTERVERVSLSYNF